MLNLSLRHFNSGIALAILALVSSTAVAQKDADTFTPFGGFGFPTVGEEGPKLSYTASYELNRNQKEGRISVVAEVTEGFHTYSTTQGDGGPLKTEIELGTDSLKLTGPFVPDHEATLTDDEAYPGIVVEEHHGIITWTAPFAVVKPIDTSSFKPEIRFDALVCGNGSCEPFGGKTEAEFSKLYGAEKTTTTLRAEGTHAVWSAELTNTSATPGSKLTLKLTAKTDPKYHVYRFVPGDEEPTFRTLIVAETKSGLKFGEPQTSTKLGSIGGLDEPIEYYDGPVEWSIPITVPEEAAEGEYPIELRVGFYTCDDASCDPPAGVAVSGKLLVAKTADKKPLAMALSKISFSDVSDSPHLASWIDSGKKREIVSKSDKPAAAPALPLTMMHLLAALAGGFILNFMPCVLPVIGLKVMSFVDQAGNDKNRVVALNLAFVAGIVSVMMALAIATVAAKVIWGSAFGWGEQFTVLEFKVALAALVFAMALSFLGVWEIPIPGFAMSSKSGELMEKEGLTGAFLKGILTTVLATPCSGPLLGSLFGLSLSLSSANVLLLYFVVGLGMSLPYLVLCIYPGFIKMLPKPGAWMETLKQALAFPLLLTVVFFVASISDGYRIATLLLLMFVWFACWLVGKVPAYAEAYRKQAAWGTGVAAIVFGAFVSFSYFGPIDHNLPWVDYNEAQLAKYRQEGKTVMIDFTANWCVNCQINMRVAIDRANVAEIVSANDVVPMVADWTDKSDEIGSKLRELNSNSIPLLAIFPADPGAPPIILRDLVTESQVVEALKEAGPSLPETKLTSTIH